MNEQEVFDKVVAHLRKQGHRAMTTSFEDPLRKGEPQCCYLDPNTGDKCAAGCLIEADEYDRSYEGTRIDILLGNPSYGAPQKMIHRLFPFIGIVSRLQTIHDTSDEDQWECQWKKLAGERGLKYIAPSENSNG